VSCEAILASVAVFLQLQEAEVYGLYSCGSVTLLSTLIYVACRSGIHLHMLWGMSYHFMYSYQMPIFNILTLF
jgi:hypothetical protein